MTAQGGLAAMIQGNGAFGNLFFDLSQLLDMADLQRVRGNPKRVIKGALHDIAAIVNDEVRCCLQGDDTNDAEAHSDSPGTL